MVALVGVGAGTLAGREARAIARWIVRHADLEITKTDATTSATPGQPVQYTITVTNHGPSDVAAATVTDAGTVSAALLSESATVAPPVGAALVRVTVQVAVELEAIVVGEHCKLETVGSAL